MKKTILIIFIILSANVFAQKSQPYKTFEGDQLTLYSWSGDKIMLLSALNTLNATTMNNWVSKMDAAYNYYALCTGREPDFYVGATYINNRSTIAQVNSTCGAGCGYLGTTGIEMLSSYFSNMYNSINSQNLYDQVPFYELGRNFWFYDSKLKYQNNDPIVTGYAVYMRFMAMEAANVNGAPFNSWTFSEFKNNVVNLLPTYMADNSLNWSNTLGVGAGVPNSNLGATDLFASFCFYLNNTYKEKKWVENVWKYAALRPDANNTQEAVNNFIIASSQAANRNLVSLFTYWKWPVSTSVNTYLNSIGLYTAVAEINNFKSIQIFPNPTSEIITIASNQVFETINVFDISGKMVYSQTNNTKQNNLELDLSSLNNGIYFIHTQNANGEVSKSKIVLSK
jgi:hypothetical protein